MLYALREGDVYLPKILKECILWSKNPLYSNVYVL